MANVKINYTDLLDKVKPALERISVLPHPAKVPVSHHLSIANNLEAIESKSKAFWDARKKMLETLAEKDKDKNPIEEEDEDGKKNYKLSEKNQKIWNDQLEELRETMVTVKLEKLHKKNFEKVNGLMPVDLRGILVILEK